jgi:N-acyl amino acid synthase of PEP-CTERM/exosortase system
VYKQLFECVQAKTPELLREAYRLRYEVYCIEHQFLDPADNPGGLERDAYDSHSVQGVLLHRDSQMMVGTVRLVLHESGAVGGSLPFHEVCQHPRLKDPNFLPLETTAELSRFAISKSFRRRADDGTYSRAYAPEELAWDPRRVIPHMALGLMTIALQMSLPHNIRDVCAVMDPALLRLVARFGIHFHTLGPIVDYHGGRQPCYANVEEMLAGVEAERPDVWEVITDCGRLWGETRRAVRARNYETV